jgi:RNA polymerase sigma-70 factor (ECF subfamily)
VDDDSEDLRLAEAAKKGDQSAWSALVKRHQDRLFSTCLRMVRDRDLAVDLTQDSFIKIIQGVDSFDGRSKLTTWMTRVTMNVCLSKLRSEKLRRHASLDAMAGGAGAGSLSTRRSADGRESGSSGELDAGSHVEAREERERVLRALADLDPEQRAILILCDCRGLPYEQIAEVLGVAVGTVKSRVFRARTALRDAVEGIERKER